MIIEHNNKTINTIKAITTTGFEKNLLTISKINFLGLPAIEVIVCFLLSGTKLNLFCSSWLILNFSLNSFAVNRLDGII